MRQNRYFLKALELKEKEKQLLIQTFEYGEKEQPKPKCSNCTNFLKAYCDTCKFTVQNIVLSYDEKKTDIVHKSQYSVFKTLQDEKSIHKEIQAFKYAAKHFWTGPRSA